MSPTSCGFVKDRDLTDTFGETSAKEVRQTGWSTLEREPQVVRS